MKRKCFHWTAGCDWLYNSRAQNIPSIFSTSATGEESYNAARFRPCTPDLLFRPASNYSREKKVCRSIKFSRELRRSHSELAGGFWWKTLREMPINYIHAKKEIPIGSRSQFSTTPTGRCAFSSLQMRRMPPCSMMLWKGRKSCRVFLTLNISRRYRFLPWLVFHDVACSIGGEELKWDQARWGTGEDVRRWVVHASRALSFCQCMSPGGHVKDQKLSRRKIISESFF